MHAVRCHPRHENARRAGASAVAKVSLPNLPNPAATSLLQGDKREQSTRAPAHPCTRTPAHPAYNTALDYTPLMR